MLSAEEHALLTQTGPGTPMGSLFRRFWLPVLAADELAEPDGPPLRLRVLGEELVAFRDTNGAIGIVGAYCAHRRAHLFFGRNVGWAWQRWEIEVCHRELEAGFGLGEPQCWNPTATEVVVAWQAWAYAVLVLAGVRAWGLEGAPPHPPGRWWPGAPRWSLGTLWRGYRQALWGRTEFHPVCAGTTDDWWLIRARDGALGNAISASLRA